MLKRATTMMVALVATASALGAQEPESLAERLRQVEERLKKLESVGPQAPGAVRAPQVLESLELGGELRLRGQFRNVGSYGPVTTNLSRRNDSLLNELRTRLNFDARVSPRLRAYVQVQDSRVLGGLSGSTAAPAANAARTAAVTDLHQAFLELDRIAGGPIKLQAGRFTMAYGEQRLVSSLEWHNIARAWDGGRIILDLKPVQVDLFSTVTANGGTAAAPTPAEQQQLFNGLYLSVQALKDHTFEGYLFQRQDDVQTAATKANLFTNQRGTATGPRRDFTAGLRAAGKCGIFDGGAEHARQFGERAGDDVDAQAWVGTAGATFKDAPWSPRLGLEWNQASGDGHAGDRDFERFDPLYPFGHAYQGEMDLIGWSNLRDAALHLSAKPCPPLTLALAAHDFQLDEAKDAWYDITGNTVVRRDATGLAGTSIGRELDASFKYAIDQRLLIWGGGGRFFPGRYVRRTGEHPPEDWAFISLGLKF